MHLIDAKKKARYNFTNYKKLPNYGPLTWNLLHRFAFGAKTKAKQLEFIELMHYIQRHFPCDICGGHIRKYMTEHPPEKYIGHKVKGLDIGMYVWLNRFHNTVNTRNHKLPIDLTTSYNMYNNSNTIVVLR